MKTAGASAAIAGATERASAHAGLPDEVVRRWYDRMGVADPHGDHLARRIDRVGTAGIAEHAPTMHISEPPGSGARDPDGFSGEFAELSYWRQLSVIGVFAALRTPCTTERTAAHARTDSAPFALICTQITPGDGIIGLDGHDHSYRHPADLLVLDSTVPYRQITHTVADPVGIWVPAELLGSEYGQGRPVIDPVQSSPLARAAGAFIVTLAVHAAVRGADVDVETELAVVDLVRGLAGRPTRATHRPADNGVIVREAALTLIERHFRDPSFSADDIAEALHMSRRNLYRRLAEVGTSPAAMIAEYRTQRARQLLCSDRPPMIEHIAKSAGFSSPATLRRHFHARFGVSPDRFRRDEAAMAQARHPESLQADTRQAVAGSRR
ncbi:helix-turn-helix domain-containing protein [Gordonia insulae]|uniref:Transcriptional activator NphR n=1 Tax=Gordonia insulae TaxID=2420509 RepID=A0A3G8JML3_9ACTN|nr:AraC family transcriptional regulator [Gordonia insulae]AZG46138.1 Transcriptional activator NphR [Gordonia insulae]